MNLKPLDCISRLAGFVMAPVVKFYWGIMSYFSFLLLFGFVLVVDFQLTPSWKELLLYLWLMSLVVEEVRQVSRPATHVSVKERTCRPVSCKIR